MILNLNKQKYHFFYSTTKINSYNRKPPWLLIISRHSLPFIFIIIFFKLLILIIIFKFVVYHLNFLLVFILFNLTRQNHFILYSFLFCFLLSFVILLSLNLDCDLNLVLLVSSFLRLYLLHRCIYFLRKIIVRYFNLFLSQIIYHCFDKFHFCQ